MGLPKFLAYLFLHATACGLRRTLSSLPFSDDFVLPSGPLKPSASATTPLSKLYQHFRGRGSPYGLQDSLSTLHLYCSPQSSRLRHRRKTRYGWVASPFPTGTFTLLDTPSFAWRDNVVGANQRVSVCVPPRCCAIKSSFLFWTSVRHLFLGPTTNKCFSLYP